MTVYLATDHAGFALKEKVKVFLQKEGYVVEDCGAHTFDKNDDYPDFISIAAKKVSENPDETKAIIFGGSGQAEAIVANKFKNVRCGLFYTPAVPVGEADATGRESQDPFEIVRLNREHNNANVLSLGARFLSEEDACKAVNIWLETAFPGDERHVRRIKKISAFA